MKDYRDTLPPTPDPMMEVVARLEDKIDRLTSIATACFSKVLIHDSELADIKEKLEFWDKARRANGNGIAHVEDD